MGCCLFALLLAGAPRVALVFWWLFDTRYVNAAFTNLLFAILGLLFLPWTTLMWVFVYSGGISMLDWVLLGIAFLIDMGTYFGSGREGRRRYAS